MIDNGNWEWLNSDTMTPPLPKTIFLFLWGDCIGAQRGNLRDVLPGEFENALQTCSDSNDGGKIAF